MLFGGLWGFFFFLALKVFMNCSHGKKIPHGHFFEAIKAIFTGKENAKRTYLEDIESFQFPLITGED